MLLRECCLLPSMPVIIFPWHMYLRKPRALWTLSLPIYFNKFRLAVTKKKRSLCMHNEFWWNHNESQWKFNLETKRERTQSKDNWNNEDINYSVWHWYLVTSLELHMEACWLAMNPTKAALPLGVVTSKVTENGASEDSPAAISPEKPFSFQKAFGDTDHSYHQLQWINYTSSLYIRRPFHMFH